MNNPMEYSQFKQLKEPIIATRTAVKSGSLDGAKKSILKVTDVAVAAERRVNKRVMYDFITLTFVLEDDIVALKIIRVSESDTKRATQFDSVKNIPTIGTMVASGYQNDANLGYIKLGTGPEENMHFYACKGLNNWAGDPQCLMYDKGRKDARISTRDSTGDLRN